MDFTISRRLSSGRLYAYYKKRFWFWDDTRNVWTESHLMSQKYEREHSARAALTPEDFMSDLTRLSPLDEYELDSVMVDALKNAIPCKTVPIEPVKEEASPVSAVTPPAEVVEPFGNTPAAPTFDFSALGDLSDQATEADQQFDLHYGAAQDEYLISCIYLARIHALTAKAGRYGGGTWTKWYESKGLSHGSVTKMVQNGEAFNSSTVDELKQLPELTRKDLNLIARSGCAEQVVAAGGDSQRVQELLAQIREKDEALAAEKARADAAEKSAQNAHKENSYFKELVKSAEAQTSKDAQKREEAENRYESALADINGLTEKNAQLKAQVDAAEAERDKLLGAQNRAAWAESHIQDVEAQRDAALADVQGLTKQNAKLQQSYHDVYESRIVANLQRQKAEAERDRAEQRAKTAEAALEKQPIAAVIDEEEIDRRAAEKAWGLADARNAELAKDNANLKKQVAALRSRINDDAQADFEQANYCASLMQAAWDNSKASYSRLAGEDLESTFQTICGTLNSIMEEASLLCRQPSDHDGGDRDE